MSYLGAKLNCMTHLGTRWLCLTCLCIKWNCLVYLDIKWRCMTYLCTKRGCTLLRSYVPNDVLDLPIYQMIMYDVPRYQMALNHVPKYQMTLVYLDYQMTFHDVPMYQMTLYDVRYLCTKWGCVWRTYVPNDVLHRPGWDLGAESILVFPVAGDIRVGHADGTGGHHHSIFHQQKIHFKGTVYPDLWTWNW